MVLAHMNNVSQRHRRIAKKAAANRPPAPRHEFKILDPHHKPDLRGELGGAKVYRRGFDQFVMMTDRQAQFYRNQGKLTRTNPPPNETKAAAAKPTAAKSAGLK